jgi:hypothetical protein
MGCFLILNSQGIHHKEVSYEGYERFCFGDCRRKVWGSVFFRTGFGIGNATLVEVFRWEVGSEK